MKNSILITLFLTGTTFVFSCGTSTTEKTGTGENVAKVYQCPMKCEAEKTYTAAGKCPVCEMNLEEKK